MLTTKQAATALGISKARVKLLCQQGRLKAKKVGRDWQIKSLERQLGRSKSQPPK